MTTNIIERAIINNLRNVSVNAVEQSDDLSTFAVEMTLNGKYKAYAGTFEDIMEMLNIDYEITEYDIEEALKTYKWQLYHAEHGKAKSEAFKKILERHKARIPYYKEKIKELENMLMQ